MRAASTEMQILVVEECSEKWNNGEKEVHLYMLRQSLCWSKEMGKTNEKRNGGIGKENSSVIIWISCRTES